ncbi:MAG: 3-deoxy-manno-octulosonate cytidylyltransferase [Taibaiella sp.]|nr:3-deoxy-manno-octulosonate cytidylyltransferase [Taibaiella sp.]
MKIIAMIPARYNASRFPGKLMQHLGSKTVIAHTYLNVLQSGLFDEVAIVTDSDEIENEIKKYKGKVLRSRKDHECGTDRIAEMCGGFQPEDIIINIQGDEPFTNTRILDQLIQFLKDNPAAEVASLKYEIPDTESIRNPNVVKVVCDLQDRALLFSRAPIPYHRDQERPVHYFKHIGIYGFRQPALLRFARWPATPLESVEKQEAMRFLEHGISIYMLTTDEATQGIDTPEDLKEAEKLLRN